MNECLVTCPRCEREADCRDLGNGRTCFGCATAHELVSYATAPTLRFVCELSALLKKHDGVPGLGGALLGAAVAQLEGLSCSETRELFERLIIVRSAGGLVPLARQKGF